MASKARLELYRDIRIKIHTNSQSYMKAMKKAFTHKVKDYYWMPKYQAGVWNGETCLITKSGTFPYGLLLDYLREHKKEHPDVQLEVDDEVKHLFKGEDLEINYDLSLFVTKSI